MEKKKNIFRIAVLLSGILLLFCCNPIEDESDSNSLLQIVSLTGSNMEGVESNYIESDVLSGSTILADIAKATLRCELISPDALAETSIYNDIMVDRYVVSYSRSDGRSREGIDVPYSFEGYLSEMIEAGASSEINFVIVRAVAKAEPPLIDLTEGRGDGVLEITAKVEFFGHDMTDRNVKATGYISIFFANYVENEPETSGGQI